MSSPELSDREYRRLQNRILDLYTAVTLLMLLGIAVLIVYAIRIGPLTSPGAQESLGLAVALMFVMAAVVFHLADRTYRSWPLGRRYTPSHPGALTTESWVRLLQVLVVVAAGAAIAYVLGGLIA